MNDPRDELLDQFRNALRGLESEADLFQYEIECLYRERAREIADALLGEFQNWFGAHKSEFLTKNTDVDEVELRAAVDAEYGSDTARYSQYRQNITAFGHELLRYLVDEYRRKRQR